MDVITTNRDAECLVKAAYDLVLALDDSSKPKTARMIEARGEVVKALKPFLWGKHEREAQRVEERAALDAIA